MWACKWQLKNQLCMTEMIPFLLLAGNCKQFYCCRTSQNGILLTLWAKLQTELLMQNIEALCRQQFDSWKPELFCKNSFCCLKQKEKKKWRHPFVTGSVSSLILSTFPLSLPCARSLSSGNAMTPTAAVCCMAQDSLTLRGDRGVKRQNWVVCLETRSITEKAL